MKNRAREFLKLILKTDTSDISETEDILPEYERVEIEGNTSGVI